MKIVGLLVTIVLVRPVTAIVGMSIVRLAAFGVVVGIVVVGIVRVEKLVRFDFDTCRHLGVSSKIFF